MYARAPRYIGAYFTCQSVLTLKIRSPDKVSGLNVSQVPFSSNVSIERSNSRERFLDFCREPERTALASGLFLSGDSIFSPLADTAIHICAPIVYPRYPFSCRRDGTDLSVARENLEAHSSSDVIKPRDEKLRGALHPFK